MSGGEDLVVALVDAPSDEAQALVAELDGILGAEYPPEQRHGLSLAAIFQPHIRFFVARQGMAPVGCAAVALFADFAEVKRMYVRDAARGGGAAPALLRRLEATAREAGLALLRLETGTRQFAALRFYEREGFRRCPCSAPMRRCRRTRSSPASSWKSRCSPPRRLPRILRKRHRDGVGAIEIAC